MFAIHQDFDHPTGLMDYFSTLEIGWSAMFENVAEESARIDAQSSSEWNEILAPTSDMENMYSGEFVRTGPPYKGSDFEFDVISIFKAAFKNRRDIDFETFSDHQLLLANLLGRCQFIPFTVRDLVLLEENKREKARFIASRAVLNDSQRLLGLELASYEFAELVAAYDHWHEDLLEEIDFFSDGQLDELVHGLDAHHPLHQCARNEIAIRKNAMNRVEQLELLDLSCRYANRAPSTKGEE